jgi:hypothetical protein
VSRNSWMFMLGLSALLLLAGVSVWIISPLAAIIICIFSLWLMLQSAGRM